MKKYLVIIGDGMAGWPLKDYSNRTSLELANIPNMDNMVQNGITGLVSNVPANLPPGSDVANLSVFGYDPQTYYTGRAPIEAISQNIKMTERDTIFRANLVYIDGEKTMSDFTSGHIDTKVAKILIEDLNNELIKKYTGINLYPGLSYRNLLLVKDLAFDIKTIPPHDITGKGIDDYLPSGDKSDLINNIMNDSVSFLANHELNQSLKEAGKAYANSLWLWGQGTKMTLPSFKKLYNLEGAVVTAVDLVKGLGLAAGLDYIEVPGITGFIDTNYSGKAEYALNTLREKDIVFVHIEAPDEAGHMGDAKLKKEAIENIDKFVISKILENAKDFDDLSVLILPDHETPIEIKTHSSRPVPFIMFNASKQVPSNSSAYSESEAKKTGVIIESGYQLLRKFIGEFE